MDCFCKVGVIFFFRIEEKLEEFRKFWLFRYRWNYFVKVFFVVTYCKDLVDCREYWVVFCFLGSFFFSFESFFGNSIFWEFLI